MRGYDNFMMWSSPLLTPSISALLRPVGKALGFFPLGALVLVSFLGAPSALAQNAQTAEYEDAAARLERALSAFEFLESRIDTSQFDVAAKAKALDYDRDRIFAFVRDEVRYEPYFGVLRGAKGTMMGLAGNAADQSVLLAELLMASGIDRSDIQFATGTLDDGRAEELLNQFWRDSLPPAVGGPPLTDNDLTRAAEILGPDWSVAQAAQVELEERALDFQETLWEDVEADRGFIVGLLRDQGIAVGASAPAVVAQAMRDEAHAHTWVQVRDASGAWVDLDPSFSGAGNGQEFSAADATVAELPDDAHHTLRLAVTLRTITEGGDGQSAALEDHVLLDVTVPVAVLVGEKVVLSLVPNAELDPEVTPDQAFARIREFTPAFAVGSYRAVVDKSFSLRGDVRPYEESSLQAVIGARLATGFSRVAAELAQITAEDRVEAAELRQAADRTWISGLWVDYTLASPSGPGAEQRTLSFRRELLESVRIDRWTRGGRAAWNAEPIVYRDIGALPARLYYSADLLVPTGATANEAYLAHARISAFTENGESLRALLGVAYRQAADTPAATGLPVKQPPARLLGFWTDRSAAAAELARARFGGLRSYVADPGLLVFESGFLADTAAEIAPYERFDIVHNPGRVVAREPGAELADLRIYEGVIETTLERLHGEADVIPDPDLPPVRSLNTHAVFAAAAEEQVPPVVLDGTDASLARLEELYIPGGVKADIATDLSRGYVVIVPERPVEVGGELQVGWWRVARADGTAVGVMPGGRGAELTNRAILEAYMIRNGLFAGCVWAHYGSHAVHCAVGAYGAGAGWLGFHKTTLALEAISLLIYRAGL